MKIRKILAVILAAMLLFAVMGDSFAATVDTLSTWQKLALTSKTTNPTSTNARIVQELCFAFSPESALKLRMTQNGAYVWIDGNFGEKTKEAVKVFQKNQVHYTLTADGAVGQSTWKAMCKQVIATVTGGGTSGATAIYTLNPLYNSNATSWQTINNFKYVASTSGTQLMFKIDNVTTQYYMLFA